MLDSVSLNHLPMGMDLGRHSWSKWHICVNPWLQNTCEHVEVRMNNSIPKSYQQAKQEIWNFNRLYAVTSTFPFTWKIYKSQDIQNNKLTAWKLPGPPCTMICVLAAIWPLKHAYWDQCPWPCKNVVTTDDHCQCWCISGTTGYLAQTEMEQSGYNSSDNCTCEIHHAPLSGTINIKPD